MRRTLAPLALLPLMVFLSGCPADGTTGDPSWTVKGTISTNAMQLDTDASVSVSAGRKLVDTTVTIPVPDPADPAGGQNVTYSVSGVPPDTYEVSVTLTSTNNRKVILYWFTVNGVQQTVFESNGPVPTTFTLTGLSIKGTTTVDFDLHPKVTTKPPGK